MISTAREVNTYKMKMALIIAWRVALLAECKLDLFIELLDVDHNGKY